MRGKLRLVFLLVITLVAFAGVGQSIAVVVNPGYPGNGSIEPSLWNGLIPGYSQAEINNQSLQILNQYWYPDPSSLRADLTLKFQYTSGAPYTPYTWTDQNGNVQTITDPTYPAQLNELGIFKSGDPSVKVPFIGPTVVGSYKPAPGDFSLLMFTGTSVKVGFFQSGEIFPIYASVTPFSGTNFGFYINGYYSDIQYNGDQKDHVIAFKAKGESGYYFGFEDGTDGDLQDHVIYGQSINPVPEPGTMVLLGSGLLGIAGWGRKKFRK